MKCNSDYLIGGRCLDCGFESFPSFKVCEKCLSGKVENFELPRKGKILSYSKVANSRLRNRLYPEEYFLVRVQLVNQIVVTASLLEAVEDKPEIGASVCFYREKNAEKMKKIGFKMEL